MSVCWHYFLNIGFYYLEIWEYVDSYIHHVAVLCFSWLNINSLQINSLYFNPNMPFPNVTQTEWHEYIVLFVYHLLLPLCQGPATPQDISITARGTNDLTVTWTLPEGGFDRYVVNISNQELNFFSSNIPTDNTTNFAGLHPGRLFYITVTAEAGNFSQTSVRYPAATGKFITLYCCCCHDFVFRSCASRYKIRSTVLFIRMSTPQIITGGNLI